MYDIYYILKALQPNHRPIRSSFLALPTRNNIHETLEPSMTYVTSAEGVLESASIIENKHPEPNSPRSPRGHDTLPMLDIPACDPLPQRESTDLS